MNAIQIPKIEKSPYHLHTYPSAPTPLIVPGRATIRGRRTKNPTSFLRKVPIYAAELRQLCENDIATIVGSEKEFGDYDEDLFHADVLELTEALIVLERDVRMRCQLIAVLVGQMLQRKLKAKWGLNRMLIVCDLMTASLNEDFLTDSEFQDKVQTLGNMNPRYTDMLKVSEVLNWKCGPHGLFDRNWWRLHAAGQGPLLTII